MPNRAGIRVHVVMFLATMSSQTTEEQKARWMEKCLSFEIIGTYAQTELGHGE